MAMLNFKEKNLLEPMYKNLLSKEDYKIYKKKSTAEKKEILQELSNMTEAEKEEKFKRKKVIDKLKAEHNIDYVETDLTKIKMNPLIESDLLILDKYILELNESKSQRHIDFVSYKIEALITQIIRNQYPTKKQLKIYENAMKMQKTGESMQKVGKSMMGAGLKTTAIVWTPGLYLGYKGVKAVKDSNKNKEE